jgi:hypothetical protein
MSFNLDAYRTINVGWSLTVGGRTYRARPVSAEQVIAYLGEMEGASPRRAQRALRHLLRHAFPRRVSFWWRGDPVDVVMRARPHEQHAMVQDFFVSLAGPNPRQSESPTSGTGSPT